MSADEMAACWVVPKVAPMDASRAVLKAVWMVRCWVVSRAVLTVVVKVVSLGAVKVVTLAVWKDFSRVVSSVDCWVVAMADPRADRSVAWKAFVMVVAKDVMLAVSSAAEWDARMVAPTGALKAGLMVDSKVDWMDFSRVERSVVHWAADLESWLVGLMVASMDANWVALTGALTVVVMVDSKVDWRDFPRVVRLVVH